MKIPERRPGTEPEPGPGPGSGTWQRDRELSPVLRTNCCLPAKLKQFTLSDCPCYSFSHSFLLSLCILLVLYLKYLSHSMQLPHKFCSVWRVDKEEDAELAASVSTAVSLYHCLPLSHYPYPSLSGTATICISIFEHLNINESPQQLQIAVGNSIPRNVGY